MIRKSLLMATGTLVISLFFLVPYVYALNVDDKNTKYVDVVFGKTDGGVIALRVTERKKKYSIQHGENGRITRYEAKIQFIGGQCYLLPGSEVRLLSSNEGEVLKVVISDEMVEVCEKGDIFSHVIFHPNTSSETLIQIGGSGGMFTKALDKVNNNQK